MAQVTGLPVVVQHQLQRRDHPCADSVAYIRSHLRIMPLYLVTYRKTGTGFWLIWIRQSMVFAALDCQSVGFLQSNDCRAGAFQCMFGLRVTGAGFFLAHLTRVFC